MEWDDEVSYSTLCDFCVAAILLHYNLLDQALDPLPPLVRDLKEEVSEDPPLCVKTEPEGTFSPPPSPPRLPGRARKAKLLVRMPWKVISVLVYLCTTNTCLYEARYQEGQVCQP